MRPSQLPLYLLLPQRLSRLPLLTTDSVMLGLGSVEILLVMLSSCELVASLGNRRGMIELELPFDFSGGLCGGLLSIVRVIIFTELGQGVVILISLV